MAGKLSGSAIQSGTITSTQLSTELGPVTSELQLVGSGVSLNVSNTAVFSGNVGIGTTSPTATLDVTGNIAFSGTMTSSSATANGVSYFNASKVLTSGSGVTYDGTNFAINSNNISAENSFGFRNRIINGDMRISQYFGTTSANYTGGGQYNIDRWVSNTPGALATGAGLASQQVSDAPTGFVNSFKWSTVSGQSATSAQPAALTQYIEGTNFADFAWGTANAKTVTLSFWVKSSVTGTYCVAFVNSDANRNYIVEYTINSADTWEYKKITAPGDTSGTWLTTTGIGLRLRFDLGSGTDSQGSANTWQAGDLFTTSNRANWIGTASATFFLTGVQLEAGSVATPFERRSITTELEFCQRYYQKVDLSGRRSGGFWIVDTTASSNSMRGTYYFPVVMRATPTGNITIVYVDGGYTGASFFFDDGLGSGLFDYKAVLYTNVVYTGGSGNFGTFILTVEVRAEL